MNGDRTSPVGLFNTARSYWRSAENLDAAGLKVTHPEAPVTFLYCHAIELYLKAYLRANGSTVEQLKRLSHRVSDLATTAVQAGLRIGQEQSAELSYIEDADLAIEARYIVTGFKGRQPSNQTLSSVAEHLDELVCAALLAAGHSVRAEKFRRPEPRQDELGDDTCRVLVYLFQTEGGEDRTVEAIAMALKFQNNLVRYHLERLSYFKGQQLVDYVASTYFVTSAGRRYVVEHNLIQL